MSEPKKFTRQELASRKSSNDAVFVIDNVVYDVTKFLDEHPGGHEVLLKAAGSDASEEFEDVGHSLDAKDLMKKFIIGEVVEEDRRELKRRQVTWEESKTENESSFMTSWKFPVLLGILMTVIYKYLFG